MNPENTGCYYLTEPAPHKVVTVYLVKNDGSHSINLVGTKFPRA